MPGLLHYHKRKKGGQIPRHNKTKKLLDKIVTPIVLLGPVVFAPQVIKIWLEKDASSLEPFTWGALTFINLVWLVYGFAHREKPIILSYLGYGILNGLMLIACLVF